MRGTIVRPAPRCLALLCAALLTTLPAAAQPDPAAVSYGADTPQELVEKVRQAAGDEDLARMAALMAPDDRAMLSLTMTMMLGVVIAFSHMGGEMADSMAEGMAESLGGDQTPEEKAQAEAERAEALAQVQALENRYEAILDGYGVNQRLQDAPHGTSAGEMLEDVDQVALIRDLVQLLDEVPGDEAQKATEQPMTIPDGELTGLAIDGDRASAMLGEEPIDFVRIDGRWYLDLGLEEKLQQEVDALPEDGTAPDMPPDDAPPPDGGR